MLNVLYILEVLRHNNMPGLLVDRKSVTVMDTQLDDYVTS